VNLEVKYKNVIAKVMKLLRTELKTGHRPLEGKLDKLDKFRWVSKGDRIRED
jgi:hypothetical protein